MLSNSPNYPFEDQSFTVFHMLDNGFSAESIRSVFSKKFSAHSAFDYFTMECRIISRRLSTIFERNARDEFSESNSDTFSISRLYTRCLFDAQHTGSCRTFLIRN